MSLITDCPKKNLKSYSHLMSYQWNKKNCKNNLNVSKMKIAEFILWYLARRYYGKKQDEKNQHRLLSNPLMKHYRLNDRIKEPSNIIMKIKRRCWHSRGNTKIRKGSLRNLKQELKCFTIWIATQRIVRKWNMIPTKNTISSSKKENGYNQYCLY